MNTSLDDLALLRPCPSMARAILGVITPDGVAPEQGVLVQCSLVVGHAGRHLHRLEWADPK